MYSIIIVGINTILTGYNIPKPSWNKYAYSGLAWMLWNIQDVTVNASKGSCVLAL